MKSDRYCIEKNIEKLKKGHYTGFLTPDCFYQLKNKLHPYEYQIFYPYSDADKVILYTNESPKVHLYKICCYEELSHSSILGSLFGIGIDNEVFGDIVFYQGSFFVYLLDDICDFVTLEFTKVGKSRIYLEEVPLLYLQNYQRLYERLEIVVSSLRIDTVIARLIGCNRVKVQEKMKEKDVLVQYEICNRSNYILQDGDVFSIKRYGKYRFRGIIKNTKKDNYVIWIDKYV